MVIAGLRMCGWSRSGARRVAAALVGWARAHLRRAHHFLRWQTWWARCALPTLLGLWVSLTAQATLGPNNRRISDACRLLGRRFQSGVAGCETHARDAGAGAGIWDVAAPI